MIKLKQGVPSQHLLINLQKSYIRLLKLVLVCIKSCANDKQAWESGQISEVPQCIKSDQEISTKKLSLHSSIDFCNRTSH